MRIEADLVTIITRERQLYRRHDVLRTMRMIIHAELTVAVVILLCAAIMARGGWI